VILCQPPAGPIRAGKKRTTKTNCRTTSNVCRVTSKSGRKRAELRGESDGACELAGVLRDLADSHGRTLRDLEQLMPYSRTTISGRLNSETRPDWKFVVQFMEACTGGDHRAMAQLEGKVRPLWEAAAPRRGRQVRPRAPAVPGQLPADIGDWVTTMRETAAAQQVVAKLQLSASRSMTMVQGLTDMLAKLTAAAQVLAEERDDLRRELVTRSDTANELLRTRALLEDTQRRLEAAERLLAQTARRLDEASRQRTEAERLKDTALLQAAAARRRLAAIEQHAVAFAEQVRAGNAMDSEDSALMGGLDQSVAVQVLSRVDDALGAEASNLDQLQGELAAASSSVVRLSAGQADNASPPDRSSLPAPEEALRRSEERYRALVQGGAQITWVTLPDGEMLEDSAEWRWITGQTAAEFLGNGWLEPIHPEDRERVERDWRESLPTGRIFEERFRMLTRSGGYRHYDVRAVPIERDGKIAEWVGACTDVTRQREAEEERHRLTDLLSAAALRTSQLQQATAMLAETLYVEQVVEVITEVGREAIGALRSAVALLEDDKLGLRVVNPSGLAPTGPDGAGVRLTLDTPSVMTRAIATRRPVLIADPEELRKQFEPEVDADGNADSSRILDTGDEQAWVGLPLLAAGMPLGALRFSFRMPRTILEEERVFLEALAGQCALAVERAEMYEKEHTAAVTLQRSLLPDELPTEPGLLIDARYLPRFAEVGGDWYDVFRLPDRRLAVVIGDVMGNGLLAAAGMGRVRNALRALALTDPRPAAVLAGLDRLFTATDREEQVATITYLVIDPETGEGEAGNAGHPPTLLLTPGALPALDGAEAGTPLGWASPRRQHPFRLPPGSTAVFYSDGLVENRRRGLDAGLDELVRVAASAPEELAHAPGPLLQYLLDHMLAGYEHDDDVTVLIVSRPSKIPALSKGRDQNTS